MGSVIGTLVMGIYVGYRSKSMLETIIVSILLGLAVGLAKVGM